MIDLEKFSEAARFELGSPGLLLLKFLLLALWLGITAVLVVSGGFGKLALAIVLLFAAGAIGADSLAYGWADENGIRFRRFLRQHFLPWERIAAVRWIPSLLIVYPKDAPLLRRTIHFPLTTSPWKRIRELFGGPAPMVIAWIGEQIKAATPGFPPWRVGYGSWKESLPVWLSLLLCLLAFLLIKGP